MKIDVRYFSKSGHKCTKKMAIAVNKAIFTTNDSAKSTTVMLDDKVDLLFLGSSVYASSPDPEVLMFLRFNKDKIGKLILFGSSCSGQTTYKKIKKVCDECNIILDNESFFTKGRFLWMNKNEPSAQKLDELKEFVKRKIEENK